MGKRASKKEMETRVSEAAELVLQGHAYSLITSHVAEKYSISRRQARRITADAYLLLKNDFEEADLNKPEQTAKILNVLENAMFQAMEKKQYAAVGTNAKVLMRLIGLDTQEVNHQHRFKHGRSSAYY